MLPSWRVWTIHNNFFLSIHNVITFMHATFQNELLYWIFNQYNDKFSIESCMKLLLIVCVITEIWWCCRLLVSMKRYFPVRTLHDIEDVLLQFLYASIVNFAIVYFFLFPLKSGSLVQSYQKKTQSHNRQQHCWFTFKDCYQSPYL